MRSVFFQDETIILHNFHEHCLLANTANRENNSTESGTCPARHNEFFARLFDAPLNEFSTSFAIPSVVHACVTCTASSTQQAMATFP